MPFGDGRSWIVPWKRVQGIPCEEIGDTTGGASSNIRTIIDNVRRYRGNVADTTALNALTSNVDGDTVLLLNDGSGNTVWKRYNGSSWVTIVDGTSSGVSSFNTRTGAVTLTSSDVTTALTYTPANKAGDTFTGLVTISGGTSTDRNGALRTTGAVNNLLFGHGNTGYLNSIGGFSSNGFPFISFYSYHSATSNTLKRASATNLPSVLQVSTAGLLEYKTAPAGTVDADISDFTTRFSISNAGMLTATDITSSTAVAISTTTAGSTPTKFLGLNAGHCLYVDATSGSVLNSGSDVIVNIDSDNNSTTTAFKVRKNTNSTTGGSDVLTVAEDGTVTVTNSITVPDSTAYVLNLSGLATTGLHWDTTTNVFSLRDAGTSRFSVDLDDGAVIGSGLGTFGGLTLSSGTITVPDASAYILNFAGLSTTGIHWDTTTNILSFRDATTSRFSVDLDTGLVTGTTFSGSGASLTSVNAVTLNSATESTTSSANAIVKANTNGKIDGSFLAGSPRAVTVFTSGASTTLTTATEFLIINKSSGSATTVNLPSSPATGLSFVIKDGKGDSATNPITVTPAAGTIDGDSTFVINTAYGAINVVYNGTQWNVF